MKWIFTLTLASSLASAGAPAPLFDWNGQEYALDDVPEPLRAKLGAAPDLSVLNGIDGNIFVFPKECDPPGSKNCLIRYDLAPSGSEKICRDERAQVGRLVSCLENTAVSYQRMTNLSMAKLRSFVERFNKLVTASSRIDWTKDVAPELAMASGGWARRERDFADRLSTRVGVGCGGLENEAGKANCETLAQSARLSVLEHASKGLVYDQTVHMQDRLWTAHELPSDLKIVIAAPSPPPAAKLAVTAPPAGGRTIKRNKSDKKRTEDDMGLLKSCTQFIPTVKLSPDQLKCTVSNGESMAFQKDVEHLMGYASILTYFDMLRLEALTATLKSHRDFFGSIPKLPTECAAFNSRLEQANAAPIDPETRLFYQSPTYFSSLKRAAVLVDQLSREANQKNDVPKLIPSNDLNMGEGPNLTMNTEYIPAQKRLTEIEAELVDLFGKFPLLKGFHESGALLYNGNAIGPLLGADPNNPEAMGLVLREAKQTAARELKENLARFCDDEATPWNELIRETGLTSSVLARFPQFQPFHQCALEVAEKEKLPAQMLAAAVGIACTLAVAGPQAVVGGPVCGALGLAMAANEYLDQRERLFLSEKCRTSGNAICTGDDYLEARRSYESAITGLVVAGVLSVGDVAVTVAAIRNMGRTLEAGKLMELTEKITQASASDASTLGRRLREVAALPEAERAQALNRVLNDALTTLHSGFARELSKALEGPESDFVTFLGKHYGVPVTNPKLTVLARAAKARFGTAPGLLSLEKESELLERLVSACRK